MTSTFIVYAFRGAPLQQWLELVKEPPERFLQTGQSLLQLDSCIRQEMGL
jgi:hypothetical protein